MTLLIGLAVHLRAALHYPMPFSDEPLFLLPARSFAARHTLAVPMLNAPNGMFWTPHGYTIVLGTVFSLLPKTVTVGRWTSFAAMSVALCFFTASTRLVRPAFRPALLIMCSAAYLSAGGIQAANTARMESFVVLAVAVAVWLMHRRRYVAAYGLLLLGCTFHAVLWPAAVTVIIALVLLRRHVDVRASEYSVLGAALLALAAEAVYYALHLHLFVTQMGYQASRRAGSSTHNATWALGCIELVVALALVLYCVRRRRDLHDSPLLVTAALIASLTLGMGVYLAYSYEFSYAVYVTGIVPLLIVFTAFTILSATEPARPFIGAEEIPEISARRDLAASVV